MPVIKEYRFPIMMLDECLQILEALPVKNGCDERESLFYFNVS